MALEKALDCRILRLPSGDWYVAQNRRPALLAVMANNNLRWPPELLYVFNGCGTGTLSLSVGVEGGLNLLNISRPVAMPCEWRLRLDSEVTLNGEPVAQLPAGTERKNGWLISDLSFVPNSGPALRRRLRQRVLNGKSQCDAAYFKGQNYLNYEREAASYGIDILNRIAGYGKIHSILDMGCSTGILLQHAKDRGLRAAGVDTSEWAISQANRRLPGSACKVLDIDSATTADFSETYDAVVMNNVLEHVKDPARLLRLAASLLNPQGFLYCATLNADSWFHQALGAGWVGYSDYSHQSPWLTAKWLRDRIRGAGLELLEFSIPNALWTENLCDEALQELGMVLAYSAAGQLLQDGWGDTVEVLARRC
ncbi:MAG: class I SAM-dependent methyltransferase [Terriglobales bacterium]